MIHYQNKTNELCEEFIDIGYMAENFEAKSIDGTLSEIRRSHLDNSMQLFISYPNIDDQFCVDEIIGLDQLLQKAQVAFNSYVIFAKESLLTQNLHNRLLAMQIVYDSEDEFGYLYGTKIEKGELSGLLSKALFLISKDGAIFYIDFPEHQESLFDIDRLGIEMNKALRTYSGVGCHGV